ncbi:hypothetical protein GLAREA_13047 [Glarea lozoyensis ATCC 20868]|uniref:Telomere-associated protein Rif1 N-terminal domain-containing protein n=1 Tax=Glarea lozoyensis (strain ATCC 20868 / MF5171) TaxID=1116229 RepID=S3CZL6_GLAL2|nr:uncharacterized protein GLAREA_13047 [Glarea lozoyensis ATCC 20868]EPE30324.1 hypothetical protein GLAREA_13047 [Glarea lozoyensis ATCC 20868]
MGEPSIFRTSIPTLTARPPTPPRESNRNEKRPGLIERIFGGSPKPALASNITPESSAESPIASPSLSTRKKVGWSDSTQYSDSPSAEQGRLRLLPLPPSAERKSSKSILKVNHGLMERDQNIGTKLLPPHQHTSFATMLESIVQQLAGNVKGARMDAYLMLAGSLKATGNVPDPKALKDKMGLLLQFISRDMQQKNESGRFDAPLVINSIILLSTFLQLPTIGESLNQEFAVFVVDHAIKVFEDPQTSKDIVKHLMFAVSQQKFPPKVMNAERVGKLITALYNIENLVKGKSIVMGRLNIYRSLVRQSRAFMITNTLWLENLFIDMLSTLKELRNLAILFGLEASLNLGSEFKVSRAFSSLFDQKRGDDDLKFAQFYADKLKSAFSAKEDTTHIPQIWSVIMLFLRGKPKQIEHWPHSFLYTTILQQCLNSSDHHTRIEANYAWNRYVFAVNPTDTTSKATIRLLVQPLISQLKLRKSTLTRKSVLGSVCNLLYYALKPSSSPAQLEFSWETYVVPLVGQSLTSADSVQSPSYARRDLLDACSILQNLFDSSFQRPWIASKALTNFQQNGVSPRELPALEPKWIRKSSSLIYPILVPILEKLFWDLGHESEVRSLWKTYNNSISAPAVMEVTVHNDTMASVASIFGLLHKIWRTGPKNIPALPVEECSSENFLKCFQALVVTTTEALGIRPFIQRQLCIGTHDVFTPVATPSQRPNKLKGEIRTPLEHLILLLAYESPNLEYDATFYQLAQTILSPFFLAEELNRCRSIEVAKDLIALLPPGDTPSSKILWNVLADFTTKAVDLKVSQRNGDSLDQPIGADYRNAVKVLDFGIILSPEEPLPGWSTLFEALVTSVVLDAGVAGKAIAVLEPVARCFMLPNSQPHRSSPLSGLSYCRLLLSHAEYPKDRQAVEAGKRRLWGVTGSGSKGLSWDPFTYFYDYIKTMMGATFEDFGARYIREYSEMVKLLNKFVSSCPTELLLGMLVKIQTAIVPWIQDSDSQVKGSNALGKEVSSHLPSRSPLNSIQTTNFWNTICSFFVSLEAIHGCNMVLSDLELLICAGLESSHKSIASRSITMWNTTFGTSEEVFHYPSQVQSALLRLRPLADIQLPFLPESVLTEELIDEGQLPLQFTESQDDSFLPTNSMFSILNEHRMPQKHVSPTLNSSPGTRACRETTPEVVISIESSASRKRSRDSALGSKGRKSRKRQSTPRLRHDDSQVQFQAVDNSSPVLEGGVSQILTKRQLEVKERQVAEAAMFPDLRSSPRKKTVTATTSPEPELPSRRSLSKTRIQTPVERETQRQLTPVPLPASEDDNFIVSSPTPKRSAQPVDLLGLPSSPPVSPTSPITNNAFPTIEIETVYEQDLPSSPPRGEVLQSADYPSAQVDPHAFQNPTTTSTFGTSISGVQSPPKTTSHMREGSEEVRSDLDPSAFPSTDQLPASSTGGDVPKATPTPSKQRSVVAPSTPPRTRASKIVRQLASSPLFVDARSSPPSSDHDTANEDIFEDAVSSPRLIVNKRKSSRISPTMSDVDSASMNDSSILRMMEDFDESSELPASETPAKDNITRRRSLRSSSTKPATRAKGNNLQPSSSIRKAALKNATATKMPDVPSEKLQSEALSPHEPQSPTAFEVPETPVPKPVGRPEKPLDIGHDLHAGDTIVVDTSSLEYAYRPVVFKKRRREDDEIDGGSVSGTTLKKRSPKKRRGRPKRSAEAPSQEPESNFEGERSQSIVSSFAIDASPEPPHTPMIQHTNVKDENRQIDVTHEQPDTTSVLNSTVSTAPESPGMQPDVSMAPRSPEPQAMEDVAVNEDNAINEPIIADNALVASENIMSVNEVPSTASNEAAEASSAPTSQQALDNEPPIATNPEESMSAFQSIKARMQSVISGLGLASFSTAQVSDIEDMFMDAKHLLYGAGKRGRTERSE